jgi:uncharacterized protein
VPVVAVIAKTPVPGRVKTRLCPPCSPELAAAIAEAALLDTIDVIGDVSTHRRVVVLDGDDAWVPDGFEVVTQRGDGLADRLANAFDDVGEPMVIAGMDTPQATAHDFEQCSRALSDHDCVVADATDGGYWLIGLNRPDRAVFEGVPMSTADTGRAQRARLAELGMTIADGRCLRDIDSYDDAIAVADLLPGSRLAKVLDR